jgi:hypothetical protein
MCAQSSNLSRGVPAAHTFIINYTGEKTWVTKGHAMLVEINGIPTHLPGHIAAALLLAQRCHLIEEPESLFTATHHGPAQGMGSKLRTSQDKSVTPVDRSLSVQTMGFMVVLPNGKELKFYPTGTTLTAVTS